jgi:lysophospholipase L1-like esterase
MLFWGTVLFCCALSLFLVVRFIGREQGDASIGVSLAVLSTFSLLLIGEGTLRVKQLVINERPFFDDSSNVLDDELGWKGTYYESAALNNSSKKILFVGDSFTEGMGIPQSKMYFAKVAEQVPAQVFAYGGRGYGTLQEYLVLKKLIDSVKPDQIVLQLCSNDFINNSYELERGTKLQRSPFSRPYLIDGKIQYKFPGMFGSGEEFLIHHSRLMSSIFTRFYSILGLLAKNGYLSTIENDISDKGTALPTYRDAVSRTESIFAMIRGLAGSTPISSFVVDALEPARSEFRNIMRRQGIAFYDSVPNLIAEAEKNGEQPKAADETHFNEAGNAIVGDYLAHKLLAAPLFR